MKHPYAIGSTLLELLIILVITGLLVQLAIPHYDAVMKKANTHSRWADLLSLQTELEACYFSQMDYRPCAEKLGSPPAGELIKEVTQFAYRLTLKVCDTAGVCDEYSVSDI